MAIETSVLSDLNGYVSRVAKLLRLDAVLLSIETRQNLQTIAVALGLMASAVALAFLGVVVLLLAAVLLLIQLGLNPSLAALVVAVALFVIAGLMVFLGLRYLKGWSLKPRRTLAQFRANIEALQASLHHEPKSNR